MVSTRSVLPHLTAGRSDEADITVPGDIRRLPLPGRQGMSVINPLALRRRPGGRRLPLRAPGCPASRTPRQPHTPRQPRTPASPAREPGPGLVNDHDGALLSLGKRSETRWVSGVSSARDVVYCAVRPAGVRPAARNARAGGEGRRFVCSSGGQGTRDCRQMRAAGLPGPPLCGYRMPHRGRNRDKTGIRPLRRKLRLIWDAHGAATMEHCCCYGEGLRSHAAAPPRDGCGPGWAPGQQR